MEEDSGEHEQEGEECDEGSEEDEEEHLAEWERSSVAEACRQKLSLALAGDKAALQQALNEAQQLGLHCREARRARDALLALESSDFRSRAGIVVDEAVDSGDWWKLQAAMQLVVGGGGDADQVTRLKDAMRSQKRRQEAARELRKAGESRDAERLRSAIEAALLAHVAEEDVRRAREALKALCARSTLREQLQQAMAGDDLPELRRVVEAARSEGLHARGPEFLREDPDEARTFAAAERKLREAALDGVRRAMEKADVDAAARALDSAGQCGVSPSDLAPLKDQLAKLRQTLQHSELLRTAMERGTKEALAQAIARVEEQGAADGDAELLRARSALRAVEAREHEGATRAQASEELSAALQSQDAARLAPAIARAEACDLAAGGGAGATTLRQAKERLRLLQAHASATRELRDAQQSSDVYKLRAALAAAKSAGVEEAELQLAGEALKSIEAQGRLRKALCTAAAQRDAETLRRLLPEARQMQLSRHDIASAEAELHKLTQSTIGQHLREAVVTGDAERLRELAASAAAAGVAGPELSQAWERLRELESQAWLRRQLADAAARADPLRLQTAIRQAELGGLGGACLAEARERLKVVSARRCALQELQLARSGGNPYAIQTALLECERAGIAREELDAAMGRGASLGGGCAAVDTAPQFAAAAAISAQPPTQASAATKPQLSSTATIPQTSINSVATNVLSSVATDVQQNSGVLADGRAGPAPLGILHNRVWSAPLRQPRPDEPPPSMLSVAAGSTVGGTSDRLQL